MLGASCSEAITHNFKLLDVSSSGEFVDLRLSLPASNGSVSVMVTSHYTRVYPPPASALVSRVLLSGSVLDVRLRSSELLQQCGVLCEGSPVARVHVSFNRLLSDQEELMIEVPLSASSSGSLSGNVTVGEIASVQIRVLSIQSHECVNEHRCSIRIRSEFQTRQLVRESGYAMVPRISALSSVLPPGTCSGGVFSCSVGLEYSGCEVLEDAELVCVFNMEIITSSMQLEDGGTTFWRSNADGMRVDLNLYVAAVPQRMLEPSSPDGSGFVTSLDSLLVFPTEFSLQSRARLYLKEASGVSRPVVRAALNVPDGVVHMGEVVRVVVDTEAPGWSCAVQLDRVRVGGRVLSDIMADGVCMLSYAGRGLCGVGSSAEWCFGYEDGLVDGGDVSGYALGSCEVEARAPTGGEDHLGIVVERSTRVQVPYVCWWSPHATILQNRKLLSFGESNVVLVHGEQTLVVSIGDQSVYTNVWFVIVAMVMCMIVLVPIILYMMFTTEKSS